MFCYYEHMKQLAVIRDQDFFPDKHLIDNSNYRTRDAARAVLLDSKGGIFLLNVSVHGYHKLPGCGVDDGESIKDALMRELMEEVGCKAEIVTELGTILEYRDDEQLTQTSYCFLARQVGEQAPSSLEKGELEEGMFEVKANSLDEAIATLEQDQPDNVEGKFIQKRDLCILRAAKSPT